MWKLNYMEELEQICSGDGFLPGFLLTIVPVHALIGL